MDHNFSNLTTLVIQIVTTYKDFEAIVKEKKKICDKNTRGVLICNNDIEKLTTLCEEIKNLLSILSAIERNISSLSQELCYNKGKLEHFQTLLNMCYSDYKNCGRNDATMFLDTEIKKYLK